MRQLALNNEELSSLAGQVVSAGGTISFRATGYSMIPFIYPGDMLMVKPASIGNLRVGDVIFFRGNNSRLTVHRVVSKSQINGQLHVNTMGDASLLPDGFIGNERVMGKVVTIRRVNSLISLETLPYSLMGYIWAKLSPYRPFLFFAVRNTRKLPALLLSMIQSVRVVRRVIKRLFINRIDYCLVHNNDVEPPLLQKDAFCENLCNDNVDHQKNAFLVSATMNSRILGTLELVFFDEKRGSYKGWWFWGMNVTALYRGGGIGERLVKYAEKKAGQKGERLNLLVRKNNRRAIALYKKLGYEMITNPLIDEEIRKSDGKENYRIIMSKRLGGKGLQ